jgi:hypothetical protein
MLLQSRVDPYSPPSRAEHFRCKRTWNHCCGIKCKPLFVVIFEKMLQMRESSGDERWIVQGTSFQLKAFHEESEVAA